MVRRLARSCVSVVGGVAVGLGLGWVGHLLIATIDEHLTEMTVSVAMAYGAFLAAETLHLSGVLATVSAAMTLGYLGRARGWIYSDGSERLLTDLWEFLAFVANAALFLLMGLTVHVAGLTKYPGAVLIGIAAALAGRAVVAYGVGSVLPRLGFSAQLGGEARHLLGRLTRCGRPGRGTQPAGRLPLSGRALAMTYGAVLFTLLVQGLTIAPLVRRLGLQGETSDWHARRVGESSRPQLSGRDVAKHRELLARHSRSGAPEAAWSGQTARVNLASLNCRMLGSLDESESLCRYRHGTTRGEGHPWS